MKAIETKIPGVLIIETDVFGDHRGYFTETYNKPKYEAFYNYAYKLTGATIGANVLMNYSNLFAPAPVGNNLEGAKKLEEKLNQSYASELQ